MSITAAQVNELRSLTGAGLMDCKKALTEKDGDQTAAIEWLRQKGIAKAAKKADRETAEGRIFLAGDHQKMIALKILCETDFVASNDDFQKVGQELAEGALSTGEVDQEQLTALIVKIGENMTVAEQQIFTATDGVVAGYLHSNGKLAVVIELRGSTDADLAHDIAMHAAAMNPTVIDPSEVDAVEIEGEKKIWVTELAGKPENIQEQIMQGKEKKYREERALLGQGFVKDNSKKIRDILGGASVAQMVRFEV